MTAARTIAFAEAYNFLRSLGIPPDAIKIGDGSFAMPTREWLARFAEAFTRMVEMQNASAWIEEVFDCENQAMRATVWAVDAHRATFVDGHAPKAGFAFGELWIGSWGHAIIFCIHENADGSLAFQAYEPQIIAAPRRIAFAARELKPADFPTVQLAKLQ